MIRTVLTLGLAYVAYKIAKKYVGHIPADFRPVLLPPPRDDRDRLTKQSERMGVEGRNYGG